MEKKDFAFMFYPGEYLRDTQCLSEKSQVAYDRIMCEHMRNISEHMINIGVPKIRINFFTKRLSDDEKTELMSVLSDVGENYQISWVAQSIEKRVSYTESRRKNRQKTYVEDMKTYDDHMVDKDINIIKDVFVSKKEEESAERREPTWRDSFEIYRLAVHDAMDFLITDKTEFEKLSRFNPGINIKLSLEKSVENFWGTEAGWKHKKKSRTKEIDMVSTLKNNIDKNKVYNPKQQTYSPKVLSREDMMRGALSMKPEDLPD